MSTIALEKIRKLLVMVEGTFDTHGTAEDRRDLRDVINLIDNILLKRSKRKIVKKTIDN